MICARSPLALGLALALAVLLPAQSNKDKEPKEKSPGDLAAEAYYKVRDEKDAPVTPERLQKLLALGLGYLGDHPAHSRVGSVINSLATFAGTMKDKKYLPLLSWWQNQLKYEALTRRTKDGVSDEQRLVWHSLEAAAAGYEARVMLGREQLGAFRDKIDRLAEQPGASRFLAGHEREYLSVLAMANPGQAEAEAKKLLGHPDKKVAAAAREELNFMAARSTPLALKFAGLDGKEFDAATLRGKKVLLVFFWSAGNENSLKDLDDLRTVYQSYKVGLDIATVCLDPEADREKVLQAAKKVKWPVCFDGRGSSELAASLNVKNPPAGFLFNKAGLLLAHGLRANKVEGEVKKALAAK